MRRKNSNRLQGYDYSLPGAYFVTLVVKERKPLFGRVQDDQVLLNTVGELAQQELFKSVAMRNEIRLDYFVFMPDHLHAIVFIDELIGGTAAGPLDPVGAHGRAPETKLKRKPRSLGSFVAAYKAASTRSVKVHLQDNNLQIWQRNFHDRVIRDQIELERIREYIQLNPLKLWEGW